MSLLLHSIIDWNYVSVASVPPGETTTSLLFTASVIVRSWSSWFLSSCLLAGSSEGKARLGDGRAVSKEAATARVEKDPFEDGRRADADAEARWEFDHRRRRGDPRANAPCGRGSEEESQGAPSRPFVPAWKVVSLEHSDRSTRRISGTAPSKVSRGPRD